ncbi:Holliday junction resolvase RuvX [Coleofasciculus sp. FACHB-1120]|nr:Holliday junction resolvase RuvX [Coleofasciculus sp. FACHB-1120]
MPRKLAAQSGEKRMERISALGLDVGKKRVGVAGCDGTGLIATGIDTIERTSFERDIEQLRRLVEERQAQVLVVGLPYAMDGTLGFQAQQVQKFATRVAAALELPLEYMDERLTSYEAEELLKTERRSLSQNKPLIDRKAAALILQRWLDERRAANKVAKQLVETTYIASGAQIETSEIPN